MIQPSQIFEIVTPFLEGKNYELITCNVSPDNHILVEIDSFDGVDVDFCAELSRYVQEHLDREVEDYELEVGSVSITDPFKTPMQYEKNMGNEVEVLTKDGKKLHGVLSDVTEHDFELEMEVMVKHEGDKKKHKEIQHIRFGYEQVKYCKYDLKV